MLRKLENGPLKNHFLLIVKLHKEIWYLFRARVDKICYKCGQQAKKICPPLVYDIYLVSKLQVIANCYKSCAYSCIPAMSDRIVPVTNQAISEPKKPLKNVLFILGFTRKMHFF